MMSVPAIDIARFDTGGRRARTSMASALASACRDIGFFHVVGHRVGDGVIAAMAQRRIARGMPDAASVLVSPEELICCGDLHFASIGIRRSPAP